MLETNSGGSKGSWDKKSSFDTAVSADLVVLSDSTSKLLLAGIEFVTN